MRVWENYHRTLFDFHDSRAVLVAPAETLEPTPSAGLDWALQSWRDFRTAEKGWKPCQQELAGSRAALQQARAELQQPRRLLAEAETQLAQACRQWQQLQGRLEWLEDSRFWKLRRHWLRLKQLFRPRPSGQPVDAGVAP